MKQQTLITALGLLIATQASAFCGFYVAKADATLFNDRSEIILVRDGLRTVITMSNDFQGAAKDFAMVVPVPVVLQEHDIRVMDRSIFQMLDSYSSPRLVEYFDDNPCMRWEYDMEMSMMDQAVPSSANASRTFKEKASKMGVTIEATYDIGEYDILILSAKESSGLKKWLIQNGYKIPASAEEVLEPYIKSNLKFFVVKVDMEQMKTRNSEFLNPIQIAFESEKFMLPIRLGMANSKGEQDMIVYAFTREGRVETVNYRTVKLPTDRNIPLFAKNKFGEFYKDVYARHHEREGKNAVTLEYAWNVSPNWGGVKCDPCVGPPPMVTQLRDAGVNWINNGGNNVFFTRLHVRYSRDKFPQDLFFQNTPNSEHFQGRYILTHPANGDLSCNDGQKYLVDLYHRRQRELQELTALTGWEVNKNHGYLEQVKGKMHPDTRNGLENTPLVPTGGSNTPNGPGGEMLLLLVAASVVAVGHHLAGKRMDLRASAG